MNDWVPMVLVLILLAYDVWLRRAKRPRVVSSRSARPASSRLVSVVGVYGTAHTGRGDIRTGPPSAVSIDCERTTFYFDMPAGTPSVDEFTIHLGVEHSRSPVDMPSYDERRDTMTIVQVVQMNDLTRSEHG